METASVRTKEDLKAAVDSAVPRIIVRGALADDLNKAYKIRDASKWAIGLLVAALATAPLTGGLSVAAATPIAALTGIEIVAIIAVSVIGIALVLLVCRDYKKVRFKAKKGDDEAELELERDSDESPA